MEWSKQKKHIEHEELWYRVSQNFLVCRETLDSLVFILHTELMRHPVKTKSIVCMYLYLSTSGTTTRTILLYSWMGSMAKLSWEGFFYHWDTISFCWQVHSLAIGGEIYLLTFMWKVKPKHYIDLLLTHQLLLSLSFHNLVSTLGQLTYCLKSEV